MAKRKQTPAPVVGPSLEDAMAELGRIVTSLENGQTSLDESLAQFERGMQLLRVCHQKLDAASQRIEIVTQLDADGTVETDEFESTSTMQKSAAASDEQSSTTAASRSNRLVDEKEGGALF